MKQVWIERREYADFVKIADELNLSAVTVRVLVNRGFKTEAEIRQAFTASLDDLYDPMLMLGMDEAIKLIRSSLSDGRYDIAIASDYDCDGIFSAYVLKLGLENIGFRTHIYTPDRIKEGYGLNRRIVDDAHADGCELIITCDNGIAAIDAVSYAKAMGLSVMVTDHHEPQQELPAADVILDPKREGDTYPFDGLCGAGVAFKLICALYDSFGYTDKPFTELLPYVAVATVADVMELRDENRILVKHGLRLLSTCCDNKGLKALIELQGLADKPISAGNIGFIIGPCFNAAGRIGTVKDSFDVLMADGEDEAIRTATILKGLNDKRKLLTEESVKRGVDKVLAMYPGIDEGEADDILVIYLDGVHESIVGLVAGKIKERFNHPAIVFTDGVPDDDDGEEIVKGSGRSIPEYNMFEALNKHKDLMIHFGGHKMAAGLSIKKTDVDKLGKLLNKDSTLTRDDITPKLMIDVPMPISYITTSLIDELDNLSPFGTGNPRPVFAVKGLVIQSVRYMGVDDCHVKLRVTDGKSSVYDAVAFHMAEEFREALDGREYKDVSLAIAYQPEINEFNGNKSIQLLVRDFVLL